MNSLVLILAIFTLFAGLLLLALRVIVVEMLRARKISHKFDNPLPINFSDNLAWALFRINQELMPRRERVICRAYSIVWFLAIMLLATTLAVTFLTAR